MFVFEWLLALVNNVFARQGFLLKNGEPALNYTTDAPHHLDNHVGRETD